MFGDFRFGPLFVRLCYELGMEDLAAATILDKVKKNIKTICCLTWIETFVMVLLTKFKPDSVGIITFHLTFLNRV